jgi:succinoglycan biosynthesis transport protein ExoP
VEKRNLQQNKESAENVTDEGNPAQFDGDGESLTVDESRESAANEDGAAAADGGDTGNGTGVAPPEEFAEEALGSGAQKSATKLEHSIARMREEGGRAGSRSRRGSSRSRGVSRGHASAGGRIWSGTADPGTGGAGVNVDAHNPADLLTNEPAAADSDVSDLADIVSRQWLPIVAIVLVCTLLGALTLSQLTPLYKARAELVIEAQRPALPALEAVLPALGTDEQSILTESAVLRSGLLLGSVVDQLNLADDPEFNRALRSPGLLDRLLSSDQPGPQASASETQRERVINSLANRLDVAEIPDSRVIRVAVTSESPDKAAEITNALVAEYLESRRTAKFDASSETNSWLETRISELQAKLLASEARAEAFRSDAELLEAGGTTLLSQQLATLNGHLIDAQTATQAARAELTEVADAIDGQDGASLYASEQLMDSPLIRELRREQVALEREIAELSSEYGPAHPRMVQLRADAADLQNQIANEIQEIQQGLRNAVRVAEAREQGLQRQVNELKVRLSQANEDEIQLRALEREAQANRELLEVLLARQKELGAPDQLQTGQPDARVISYAAVPAEPSFPQMGISMAAIFIVSALLALVVAFVREVRRQGFTTLEQLEATIKLTALGFIPLVSSRRQQPQMLDSVVKEPGRPFALAMSTLNWQLDETLPSDSGVILMTSAVPGEGKTTMAVGIARTKAMKGQKTLLIDADLRDPSVHGVLGLKQKPGLRDVIEGSAELADVIQTDEASSLEVLAAGAGSSDALGVVESPKLDEILAELVERYDYIIVDSPPVASAPDACALSKLADTTVMTVRWSNTPVNTVKYALRILERNGGHVAGTVLNMVESSKSLSRNKGYFSYYGDYGTSKAG